MGGTVTAFLGDEEIGAGEKAAVTRLIEERYPGDHSAILVFDDETGRVVDLDYWDALAAAPPRPRGRPKIGVAAREVTLLPRHWEWLAQQPGGASAALRRLVEEARGRGRSARERHDAVYRFLQATSGDRPGYEEALRLLYRGDWPAFRAAIAAWPEAVRRYVEKLGGETDQSPNG